MTVGKFVGIFDFAKVRLSRIAFDIADLVQVVLVPLVTYMLLHRIQNSLKKTSRRNTFELSVQAGIRKPVSVHGQSIPVHFDDIENKSQVCSQF